MYYDDRSGIKIQKGFVDKGREPYGGNAQQFDPRRQMNNPNQPGMAHPMNNGPQMMMFPPIQGYPPQQQNRQPSVVLQPNFAYPPQPIPRQTPQYNIQGQQQPIPRQTPQYNIQGQQQPIPRQTPQYNIQGQQQPIPRQTPQYNIQGQKQPNQQHINAQYPQHPGSWAQYAAKPHPHRPSYHSNLSAFIPPDIYRRESIEEIRYDNIANKPRMVRIRTPSNWNLSRATSPFEVRETLSTEERYQLVPMKSTVALDFEPYSHREYRNLKSRDRHMRLPSSLGPSENEEWRKEVVLAYIGGQTRTDGTIFS
jgi:hypothetical protein